MTVDELFRRAESAGFHKLEDETRSSHPDDAAFLEHGVRLNLVGDRYPKGLCVTANGAVVAIAAVFLNSYLGRVARMPAYWLPPAGLAGIVALYFVRTRRAALRLNGNAGADPSG